MTKVADLTKNGACTAIDKTKAADLLFNLLRHRSAHRLQGCGVGRGLIPPVSPVAIHVEAASASLSTSPSGFSS